MKTINLVVPPDIEEGDSLCFEVEGHKMELALPYGAQAGDELQIEVATASDMRAQYGEAQGDLKAMDDATKAAQKPPAVQASDDESVEVDEIISVPLSSSFPGRTKQLQIRLTLDSDRDDAEAIHTEIWPTGLLMAKIITHPKILTAITSTYYNKNPYLQCLEVGSGLGTVGLAMGAALNRYAGKSKVVLTDVSSALPFLEANIEANKSLLGNKKLDIKAEELEWGKHSSHSGRYDIICGSDILYGPEPSYQPLFDTMADLLADGGIVLLGSRWRQPAKERKFFALAECFDMDFVLLENWIDCNSALHRLDIEELLNMLSEYRHQMPRLSWGEYGDMDNKKFVNHLNSTKVSTGGGRRVVSLMDLSEKDMQEMNDKEHKAFEKTQIQIYVGTMRADSKRRPLPPAAAESVKRPATFTVPPFMGNGTVPPFMGNGAKKAKQNRQPTCRKWQ